MKEREVHEGGGKETTGTIKQTKQSGHNLQPKFMSANSSLGAVLMKAVKLFPRNMDHSWAANGFSK